MLLLSGLWELRLGAARFPWRGILPTTNTTPLQIRTSGYKTQAAQESRPSTTRFYSKRQTQRK